ncbi:16S rRNA (uracil(1498)-N(3))-methyltransferase [Brevibacterium album]|uniref:16S rRNA (uracil(1498)-N(3))-methyltransferase n=1 Tax=Brevibacterium album TaxID=417948 RepID=UPI00041F546A|nr:16S rRNA (uracil(1498)-N(3))-methyltransferase [Brevibacterium album]
MSLPVFLDRALVPAPPGETLALSASVAKHLGVVRIRAGEEFELVDGDGLRLRAVLGAEPGTAEVRAALREVRPRPELVLVQALAKGDRDEQAIEAATEIGVDRIVPWQAARSIARWPAKKEQRAHARWRSLLDAAAQQSRRAFAPELEPLARGRALAGRFAPDDLVLVLHEEAEEHLTDVLADGPGADSPRIVLVVGPEGGIAPEEIAALTGLGARPVLLGPTVLRASSAGPAGLVLVTAALGRWSRGRAG